MFVQTFPKEDLCWLIHFLQFWGCPSQSRNFFLDPSCLELWFFPKKSSNSSPSFFGISAVSCLRDSPEGWPPFMPDLKLSINEPKVRFRFVDWKFEIGHKGGPAFGWVSETGNCRNAKKRWAWIWRLLRKESKFQARRVKKEISRLKGVTPELRKMD